MDFGKREAHALGSADERQPLDGGGRVVTIVGGASRSSRQQALLFVKPQHVNTETSTPGDFANSYAGGNSRTVGMVLLRFLPRLRHVFAVITGSVTSTARSSRRIVAIRLIASRDVLAMTVVG